MPQDVQIDPQTGERISFDTPLTSSEEIRFQSWKKTYAPNDSGEDYDLRGAFKAGLKPDPKTGHWPDTFKKPNEPTFSNESIYAKYAPDKAGHWEGPNHDQYVPASPIQIDPATGERIGQSDYMTRQNALIDKMQADAKGGGLLKSVGEDLSRMVPQSGADLASGALNTATLGASGTAQFLANTYQNDQARKAEGRSAVYRAIAPVGEAIGVNARGMEQAANKGDTSGVVGHTIVPTATALAAPAIEGAGKIAGKIAPSVAESALEVGSKSRGFGKTPGQAALDETTGLTPAAVLESTHDALNRVGKRVSDSYSQSQAPVSLQPAVDALMVAKNKALRARQTDLAADIQKNIDRLSIDPATGQKRLDMLPEELWRIKQGQGDSTNWNPTTDQREAGKLNRKVYAAIDGELDRVAPDTADLNQVYSSLVEVKKRADIENRKAGIIQGATSRWKARTGALAAGAATGAAVGGIPGAIAGAVVGSILPELVTTPAVPMAAARGLNAASKVAAIPAAKLGPASINARPQLPPGWVYDEKGRPVRENQ